MMDLLEAHGDRIEGAAPFDRLASAYDDDFSRTQLGRLLRDAVHEEIGPCFKRGDAVLDLGCGTGEDALRLSRRGVHVHGIDASRGMIEAARAKAAGFTGKASVRPVFDWVDVEASLPAGPFDGAFSNFGVMNCLRDICSFAARLAGVLRPGAPAVLVVMGPYCPWEWVWFGARGRFGRARRRLSGCADFAGTEVHYPTPGELVRDFQPYFRARRVAGIGVLLPPTFAAGFVERHPCTARALESAERLIRRRFPATHLNDHFLVELERV